MPRTATVPPVGRLMADAEGDGDDGLGLRDPLPALPHLDDYEDVLHLLNDTPDGHDGADPVPAPAAALMAVQHDADPQLSPGSGFSGDDFDMDWPDIPDNFLIGDDGAGPSASQAPSGLPVHGGAPSTSAAAAAAPQADVLDCSGCQVLREILHSNGLESTKLCIHGDAGVFYHATLEVYRISSDDLQPPALTNQSWIDFRIRDYEWVKQYLTDYAQRRAACNFAVVHDSLMPFHDVLCTTMNHGVILDSVNDNVHERRTATDSGGTGKLGDNAAAAVQPPTVQQGDMHPTPGLSEPSCSTVDIVQQPSEPVVRSALAVQRERIKKLQLHDIAPYFHLPMLEAAEKLGIGCTVLKVVCRKAGVKRWPHRKLKKIDRQIAKLRRSGDDAWAKNEIDKLSAEKRRIFEGLE